MSIRTAATRQRNGRSSRHEMEVTMGSRLDDRRLSSFNFSSTFSSMRKGNSSSRSNKSNSNSASAPNYRQLSLDDFSDDDSLSDHETTSSDPARRQLQTLQDQDHGLELLSQATDRLGAMSMAISEELGQHNRILDEMDNDLEQATTNMDMVTRKTKEFIDQSGGTRNFMLILCLSVVVVVLVFLLLYT